MPSVVTTLPLSNTLINILKHTHTHTREAFVVKLIIPSELNLHGLMVRVCVCVCLGRRLPVRNTHHVLSLAHGIRIHPLSSVDREADKTRRA